MFIAADDFKVFSRPTVELIAEENASVMRPSGLTLETYGVTVFSESSVEAGRVSMIWRLTELAMGKAIVKSAVHSLQRTIEVTLHSDWGTSWASIQSIFKTKYQMPKEFDIYD